MTPMKKSVSTLLEMYQTFQVRKLIIDSVFDIVYKLHSIGINHGDAHLENIMVTYKNSPRSFSDEMEQYLEYGYIYKFIDFGVAENITEREKYKQMIGDYAKIVDWIGIWGDSFQLYKYAEGKTLKLSIQYGLRSEDDESSDDDL